MEAQDNPFQCRRSQISTPEKEVAYWLQRWLSRGLDEESQSESETVQNIPFGIYWPCLQVQMPSQSHTDDSSCNKVI